MPTEKPSMTLLPIPIARANAGRCAAQHFGAWSIEPKWFRAATDAIRAGTIKPKAAWDNDDDHEDDEADTGPSYTVTDGIALVTIDGQMTKKGSSFGGCSTIAARQAVRMAVNDYAVKAIMLHICSPGGTCAGTADLAEDVAAAGKIKPTDAYIADIGCSAAYWVASQCRTIYANTNAMVGSIGTYVVLEDDTALQDQIGIKYRVVSTGDYKGLGADGKVSDQLVADVQREVNELNAPFLAAVAVGRGDKIPDIAAVSDGRAHVSAQAKQLGLIDTIASLDAAMSALSSEIDMSSEQEFKAYLAANPDAAKSFRDEGFASGKTAGAADGAKAEQDRFKALADKFGTDRPTFVIEQFAKGNDVGKASIELADVLMAENKELQAKIAAAPAGKHTTVPQPSSAKPIPAHVTDQREDGDPKAKGSEIGEKQKAKLLARRGIKA